MHQGNHAQLPGFGASKLDHRNNALHPNIKQEYGHRSIPVLHAGSSSMERGITDNPQGLPTPDPSHDGHQQQSKASSADPTSAVGYVTQQEGRSATYSTSTSATPTSEYNLYSDSARSGSFSYGPTANHNGLHHNPVNHGGLQQHGPVSHGCANPPCDNLSCPNPACVNPGNNHPGSTVTMAPAPSNPPVPSPSPSYPPTHYQPFQGQPHGLPHGYHNPGASGMYAQPRPDWGATYAAQTSPGAMPSPHHHVFQQAQPPVPPANRQNQVYSFVPIPGAQQTKRPRRRWEDIERMYMCNHPLPGGGNCQKAYGTLNHLNAHVQMQHHGPKRTPEEFKEIRKEWKARKKEEENKRKQAEEQQRQAQAAAQPRPEPEPTQVSAPYPRSQLPLPPLGYQSQPYPTPTSMPDYGGNNAYPPYPYAQGPQGGQAGPSSHPLYPPPNGGQQN